MSPSLRNHGTSEFARDWQRLSAGIARSGEGYALTDAKHAYLYRQEVAEFCGQTPPQTAEEFAALESLAESLLERWSGRVRPESTAGQGE
ncbi:MAG: hypothetical protein M3552_09845 [Planctomycetota bacterium]|nr:hypothetical protein [Planctomycetaceae bacterium]MDQ3330940.1 hypothetical protein [Planctomycetota bacterium]